MSYIICWPLKIDYICGIEDWLSSARVDVCDPSNSNVIDSNFGSGYAQMKELGKQFTAHSGNISFNYTRENVKKLNAVKLINETSKEIKMKVEEKANYFHHAIRLVDKLMILIYFKIIYGKTSASAN